MKITTTNQRRKRFKASKASHSVLQRSARWVEHIAGMRQFYKLIPVQGQPIPIELQDKIEYYNAVEAWALDPWNKSHPAVVKQRALEDAAFRTTGQMPTRKPFASLARIPAFRAIGESEIRMSNETWNVRHL